VPASVDNAGAYEPWPINLDTTDNTLTPTPCCHSDALKRATHPLIPAVGAILVALWLAIVVLMKVAFYRRGIVIGDLYLYANALVNTHLPNQILYIADYQLEHGTMTLVLDHFEPSSVLLIPFFQLFETPLCLVMLQGLVPAVLAGAIVFLAWRLAGATWLGWAVAVFTLYNPAFIDAVIDTLHHDAQYLVYTPLFLSCFLMRRFAWATLFFILFLGIKEDAAFFGMAFGTTLALFDLPWGGPRRGFRLPGLTLAAASALYFLSTVVVLPHVIASPNIYAHAGFATLSKGLGHIIRTTWHNFFALKWHNLWLYFFYAFGSPAFVLAGLPDIAMFSIMSRNANLYFDFTIVTFLTFGVLLTLMRLRSDPPGMPTKGWRRAVKLAFILQLILCVPMGLWELNHLWVKGNRWRVPSVSTADAETAWHMVDLSCTVAVLDSLLQAFYRAPFLLLPRHIGAARYVVVTDRDLLALSAAGDWVPTFFATQASQLDLIGHSGPVTVWRNHNANCLPW
jgi:hypothetical protein